jgi:hypothetical protein
MSTDLAALKVLWEHLSSVASDIETMEAMRRLRRFIGEMEDREAESLEDVYLSGYEAGKSEAYDAISSASEDYHH